MTIIRIALALLTLLGIVRSHSAPPEEPKRNSLKSVIWTDRAQK